MSADELDISSSANAVARSEEAFGHAPANDLVRDVCVQRVEYTYELAWRMMRRHLMFLGLGAWS